MKTSLCHFAHKFPVLAANILHRDRHKRRNFREETITDLLMAGLTAFEPFGIITDFPEDESKTGEDMDWEFVSPQAKDGRRYLRLHIQAKRAINSGSKILQPYWYYRELDHAAPSGAPKGSQHKLLLDAATTAGNCIPMYFFYHPNNALKNDINLPNIEGVNAMFADIIPINLSKSNWPRNDKKVEKWRPNFMPLSDILCFPPPIMMKRYPIVEDLAHFQGLFSENGFVTPGALVDRLRELRGPTDKVSFEASSEIPKETLQTINSFVHREPRYGLEIDRPRAIFLSGRS